MIFYGMAGTLTLALVHFNALNKGKNEIRVEYLQNQMKLERQIKDYDKKFEAQLDAADLLRKQLEEQADTDDEKARNDPNSKPLCISPDGVRRLNKGLGNR